MPDPFSPRRHRSASESQPISLTVRLEALGATAAEIAEFDEWWCQSPGDRKAMAGLDESSLRAALNASRNGDRRPEPIEQDQTAVTMGVEAAQSPSKPRKAKKG